MAAPTEPRNIYIVGAQGTGKTTLVHALERHFGQIAQHVSIDRPRIVSEVARTVQKQHPIEIEKIRSDPQQSLNLQRLILAAQARAEEDALSRGSWFVSDRSGLDPLVYARRYAGSEGAEEMILGLDWLKLKGRMADSVVVVCEPGAPWLVDDGVRLMPIDGEDWMQLHRLFCEMLEKAGIPYHVLPGATADLSERVCFILSAWACSEVGRADLARLGETIVE